MAMATGRDKLVGHLACIGFAVLIAVSFSLGKLVVPYIEPAPINAVRFLLASVIMGVFAFGVQGHKFSIPVAPWRYAILSAMMAWYFLSMFIALQITSPVSTSAVYTLTPLVTAVLAFFILRQKTRPVMALSLTVAAIGAVWIIFRADIAAILAFNVGEGEAIYFTGCFTHAIFTVLLFAFRRGEPLSVSTFYIVVGNAIWLGIFGIADIMTTDWTNLPPLVWLSIVYLAVGPSAITFALVQFATHRLPASKVMAYGYLVPVFVIINEGIIGNGWTSLSVAVGAAVTCLGLVVLYFTADE